MRGAIPLLLYALMAWTHTTLTRRVTLGRSAALNITLYTQIKIK
jgi:hypothetical protein